MSTYTYGAARTAADLRKAGRLIHDLRREIAQATTERDAAQAQLRRTAAHRDPSGPERAPGRLQPRRWVAPPRPRGGGDGGMGGT